MSAVAYADHAKLIHHFAHRVARRLKAAGARVLIEDIEQELNVAWTIAARSFNDNLGVPFLPYLRNGMQHHINRWAEKELGFAHQTPISFDADEGAHQRLSAHDQGIDERLAEHQHWARISNRLGAEARKVLELLLNPPDFLVEEFRALQAKRDWGRERGYNTLVPGRITTRMAMDLIGLQSHERARVSTELKEIIAFSERVNQ